MPLTATEDTLANIARFDTPSVFNVVRTLLGGGPEGEGLKGRGGVPINYTDESMRCMLPELGMAVGVAVTCEVTTNDEDSPELPWGEYYDYLEATPGPKITIIKDVDSRPGRGAALGDVMASMHRLLGVTGIVVDGTVRDISGLRRAGVPTWATGRVSGHGLFHLVRVDVPVTVADLPVDPGDLMAADADGVVSVPRQVDPVDVLRELEAIRRREDGLNEQFAKPDVTLASIREYLATHFPQQ